MAGHSGAAMAGGVLGLAILSVGYAPAARVRSWAREHVVDLWAMALLMLALLWGGARAGARPLVDGGAQAGASAHVHPAAQLGAGVAIAAVVLWAVIRVGMMVRAGVRVHSVVAMLVCGAGMLWMIAA